MYIQKCLDKRSLKPHHITPTFLWALNLKKLLPEVERLCEGLGCVAGPGAEDCCPDRCILLACILPCIDLPVSIPLCRPENKKVGSLLCSW